MNREVYEKPELTVVEIDDAILVGDSTCEIGPDGSLQLPIAG